ncbi:MAG: lipase family protein [Mariprofundaceae bacterium]|nr:lipase family protein [Mariprofundaceae bacterium]
MSKVEDASLAIEKQGRTFDGLGNPRKYKSSLSSLSKQAFEQAWEDKPEWLLANFSHIAYYDAAHVQSSLKGFGFKVTFYDDGHGRQGFLAVDADKAILAIRGTEPSDIRDVIDDLRVCPISYKAAKVHRGFLDAAQSLMQTQGDTESLEASLNKLNHHTLYATGHSLGAAMAVIVGMSYAFEKIVTFGEPRVGAGIILQGDDGLSHTRFVNGKDIVTAIIPEMPIYTHHGVEQKLFEHEESEFFVGSILDHSIINYVERLKEQA